MIYLHDIASEETSCTLTFSSKAITSSWFRQYGAYTFFMESISSLKQGPVNVGTGTETDVSTTRFLGAFYCIV